MAINHYRLVYPMRSVMWRNKLYRRR